MKEILAEILKNKISAQTKSKGKNLLINESVEPYFELYQEGMPLLFRVQSESSFSKYYNVEIELNKNGEHKVYCTCPQHKIEPYCKHVTACLQYLYTRPDLHSAERTTSSTLRPTQRSANIYLDSYEITKGLNYKEKSNLEGMLRTKKIEIVSHIPEKNLVTFSVGDNEVKFTIKQNYVEANCTCPHNERNFCIHARAVLLFNYFKYHNPYYISSFRDISKEKEQLLKSLNIEINPEDIDNFFEFSFQYNTLQIKEKKNVLFTMENSGFTTTLKSLADQRENTPPPIQEVNNDGYIMVVSQGKNGAAFILHAYNGTPPDFKRIKAKQKFESPNHLRKEFPEYADLVFTFSDAGIVQTLRENDSLSTYYRSDSDEINYHMTASKWKVVIQQEINLLNKKLEWLKQNDTIYTPIDLEKKLHKTNIKPLRFNESKIKVTLKLKKEPLYLEITPALVLNDEYVNLNEFRSIDNLIFIKENIAYIIENYDHRLLLENFKNEDNFKIFNSKIQEFLKDFLLPISKKFNIDVPADLLPETMTPKKTEKAIRLNELEPNYLLIEPFMIYDDHHVSIYDNEAFAIKNNKTTRIKRNWEEEKELENLLIGLHHDFEQQKTHSYFYLTIQKALQNMWFFEFFDEINKNGIKIYGDKNLKKLNFSTHKPTLSIKGNSGIDWFDLKIELTFGEEIVPLKILRAALVNNQDYVVLSDGKLGMLPKEWIKRFTPILKIGNTERNKLRLSKLHFNLLDTADEFLVEKKIKAELAEKKAKLMGIDASTEISLPKNVKAKLRPYQEAGFQWFNKLHHLGWGGCLADDMGLGKTLQSLTFICHVHNQNPKTKSIIVCPTSLMYNWIAEAEKFTPSLRTHIYHGSQRDISQNYDLLITSYGTLRNDLDKIKETEFEICILDESQAIKNPLANVSKSVGEINAKTRFALSGTPLQNNTFDLYSQFNFINPGLLGSQEYFKEEFSNPIDKNADSEKSQLLKKMIYPFMLRRTKDQVAKDLPSKTESVIYCEMGSYQRKVYDALKVDYRNKILGKIESEGIGKSAFLILEGLNRLRMACDCPSLLKETDGKTFKQDSIKLNELVREIDENAGEHKVLIFSQFLGMLDLIKVQFEQKGITYLYLDGSTPAKDRQGLVDQFQSDSSIKAFLISLKAGGVGLNLTAADYVYIVDPWWNPAVEDQAIDRTHRIGQTNKIFAYKLICKDSIEEKIHKLQQKKKALAKEIVAEEASFIKNLTKDDVAWLLE